MDLFDAAAEAHRSRSAPLADRARPARLEELAGQPQLLGASAALRRAIDEDRVGSSIFFGPPGSGKTTLARVIAQHTKSAFEELSAVQSGKADVQAVIGRARERLGGYGQPTLLFIDEIHRFNKAQQDALLPVVESGLVTLIGATTENPYHSIIGALLSRCRLYEFLPHAPEDLRAVLARGAALLGEPAIPDEVLAAIAESSAGDARSALTTLELAHEHASSRAADEVSEDDVAEASRRRPIRYDRDGDAHYDTISAFIKSMRGSDPDAALYYLACMIEGGEDPIYLARRLVIFASEDVGNADPRALELATAAAAALQLVGMPEGRYALAQATTYLALTLKSNAAGHGIGAAGAAVREHGVLTPPAALRDGSYRGAREIGRGVGYRYPHDAPDAWVDVEHLPDKLAGTRFYQPSERGVEARLRERHDELRRRRGLG